MVKWLSIMVKWLSIMVKWLSIVIKCVLPVMKGRTLIAVLDVILVILRWSLPLQER